MSETRLYAAVKSFLAAQGFAAKGEVCGCDVVAVRPGEPPILVICELKLGFNLELLLQAADRMAAADAVWLAVPQTRRGRDRDRRVVRLCRLLGLGLLTVGGDGAVAVLADPAPYRPRPNTGRRTRLLREHTARRGDPTPGGSVGRSIMTAYRQRALLCAGAMRDGPATTRALSLVAADGPRIAGRNVYGWFERVTRGSYRLSEAGWRALAEDPAVALARPSNRPLPEASATL